MKKILASVLTTAMVVGAASTTFAAANPFSDVPAGHWAYDAVTQLAADGVVEGYGDGTYRGDREITRYEMAQMIAKAMAKNPSGVDKAMLDRLAAEFSEELNNLGVRVANLEKHADMVQWKGKVEYTYTNTRLGGNKGTDKVKTTGNGYVFRLEPKAEVNDHWTVNARLDAEGDMKSDETTDVTLKRAWAQGDYGKFQIKLGRMEYNPVGEHGLIMDTELSGVEASYGDKWKAYVRAGRLEDTKVGPLRMVNENLNDDPSSFWNIQVQYDPQGKGFLGGLGYTYIKDEDFRTTLYHRDTNTNKAAIFSANLGYNFSDKATLWGTYAHNSKADRQKNSWQAQFTYGDYHDAAKKGSWNAYLAYRKLGVNTSMHPTEDGVLHGTKGIEVGAAYAPFKNVGLLVKYFKGEYIDTGIDAQKFFGRVEFFF